MIKTYYQLTKPGIIYGNALMYTAGFFLGAWGGLAWPLFLEGLLGLSLIIASAAVFNNYADRALDAKMPRTHGRPLVSGSVSPSSALLFGTILFIAGAFVLHFFSNWLALVAALCGFVVYVFLYTPLKPRTPYALFVGAVAGAMPPVVGYVAASNTLDVWALLLFCALFLWQIPHFLAIAHYRFEDYQAGGVPLFITRPPASAASRRRSRKIFFASLVVLLVACLSIVFWRLLAS